MGKFEIRFALPALAFAAVLPLTSAADAETYAFNLSGPITASFMLDSSPTPSAVYSDFFTLENVLVTFDGSTTLTNLSFFDSLYDGGFSGGALSLGGGQLFTGSLASPTFKLGTFDLSDDAFFSFKYTLSVTSGAVPEPSAWTMILLGFGAIAFRMRHRERERKQPA
jgi:hypothetical protein